ncbi:MAG: chemotaxis protein CheA, partial [bacterium]
MQSPPDALVTRLEQLSRPPSERVQVIQAPPKPATEDSPVAEPAKTDPKAQNGADADDDGPDPKPARPKRKGSKSKPKKQTEAASIKAADDARANAGQAKSPAGPGGPGSGASTADDYLPRGYRIRFAPGRDVFKRGMNPLGVLDELADIGEAFLRVDPSDVPTLDAIDPQLNYLTWEIELHTDEPISRIQDVFLFVGEDCRIEITELPSSGQQSDYEKASVIHKKLEIAPESGTSLLPEEAIAKVEPAPVADEPPSRGLSVAIEVATQPDCEQPTRTSTVIEQSIMATGAAAGMKPGMAGAGPSPTMLHPAGAEALSKVVRSASSRAAASGSGATAKNTSTPRIRVDAAQLDDLVGLAGELAVLADNLQGLRDIHGAEPYRIALESLERVCRQVRDQSLELRMVPVEELFSRFPRLVRDLADKSGKEIQLRIEGHETRLDRTIVERLAEPMIHLIRNSVDHGLETPEERLAAGKPRQGQVVLWAGHEGDRVALKIEDDGRGLNRARILEKGINRGLIAPNTSPDDPRVISLIFEPGFSTRDTVSELSGRGV